MKTKNSYINLIILHSKEKYTTILSVLITASGLQGEQPLVV